MVCSTNALRIDLSYYAYLCGISLLASFTIVSVAICIVSFYQLYCKSAESVSKYYRLLTIICMVSSTLCSIGDLIHIIIRFIYFPYCTTFYPLEAILDTVKCTIYFFGNIMFYILLLQRIYFAFKLNKIVTICLWAFIMIAALSSIFYILLVFHDTTNIHRFSDQVKYAAIPLSATDFILNFNLFIIFWYQMRKTVIDVDIQSNIYQNIANVLTKHIVLFSIAIFTTQLFYIFTLIYSFEKWTFQYKLGSLNLNILFALRSAGICMNVLVLWLVLNINYDKYICICKCCHLCVAKCCVKNNTNPLQNPYLQMKDF